jgi:hypothetical protein
MSDNPVNAGMQAIAAHPRCRAHARTTGQPCRCPAMANGRCKLHGGKSPGAPQGVKNGNFAHGQRTQQAARQRRELRGLLKGVRELLAGLKRR